VSTPRAFNSSIRGQHLGVGEPISVCQTASYVSAAGTSTQKKEWEWTAHYQTYGLVDVGSSGASLALLVPAGSVNGGERPSFVVPHTGDSSVTAPPATLHSAAPTTLALCGALHHNLSAPVDVREPTSTLANKCNDHASEIARDQVTAGLTIKRPRWLLCEVKPTSPISIRPHHLRLLVYVVILYSEKIKSYTTTSY
jgi:hypothetical protein